MSKSNKSTIAYIVIAIGIAKLLSAQVAMENIITDLTILFGKQPEYQKTYRFVKSKLSLWEYNKINTIEVNQEGKLFLMSCILTDLYEKFPNNSINKVRIGEIIDKFNEIWLEDDFTEFDKASVIADSLNNFVQQGLM